VQEHIISLVKQALEQASVTPEQIDCIAYTKVQPAAAQQQLLPSALSPAPW